MCARAHCALLLDSSVSVGHCFWCVVPPSFFLLLPSLYLPPPPLPLSSSSSPPSIFLPLPSSLPSHAVEAPEPSCPSDPTTLPPLPTVAGTAPEGGSETRCPGHGGLYEVGEGWGGAGVGQTRVEGTVIPPESCPSHSPSHSSSHSRIKENEAARKIQSFLRQWKRK